MSDIEEPRTTRSSLTQGLLDFNRVASVKSIVLSAVGRNYIAWFWCSFELLMDQVAQWFILGKRTSSSTSSALLPLRYWRFCLAHTYIGVAVS